MTASQPSPQRRRTLLGSHNRCWIWGRHVVLETLRGGRWRPLEIRCSDRCPAGVLREVRQWAEQHATPCAVGADSELDRQCRSQEHQGVAARMPPFPYQPWDEFVAGVHSTDAFWLILDRLQDSFNFGAIVRSACSLGAAGMLIGAQAQSEVNSQVVRSSAGAVNHLPICRVESLTEAVDELRVRGVRLVAVSEKADRDAYDADLTGRVALVIGNEGEGIHPELWRRCDSHVRIPMQGGVGSLNAAVAAGILCYELARQRARCAD